MVIDIYCCFGNNNIDIYCCIDHNNEGDLLRIILVILHFIQTHLSSSLPASQPLVCKSKFASIYQGLCFQGPFLKAQFFKIHFSRPISKDNFSSPISEEKFSRPISFLKIHFSRQFHKANISKPKKIVVFLKFFR